VGCIGSMIVIFHFCICAQSAVIAAGCTRWSKDISMEDEGCKELGGSVAVAVLLDW